MKYYREDFHLMEIDSCHLLFYKNSPTGFFWIYNFCDNYRINNFTTDSLPHGVIEMDSIFLNWNSRPHYNGTFNINDRNFEYRISGYGEHGKYLRDIERINLNTNKSQRLYYNGEMESNIEHGLFDKRFIKYKIVKGIDNSIEGFVNGNFYSFQKDSLIKYVMPNRKRYNSYQTSNPLQIDSTLYSIGENVIKYGVPLIKESVLFKYDFINNKTDTCYLKKYYGRVESILIDD